MAEIQLAATELAAFQAIRESQETQALELARREDLARWLAAELDHRTANDASIAWINANADDMGAGLLLPTSFGPR